MGKKIYINESILKNGKVKRGVLAESLSKKLIHDIINGETSLGKASPLHPEVLADFFMKKFDDNDGYIIGGIDMSKISLEEEESLLNELIIKCQEIETPIRNELEQECFNFIVNLFEIPDESVSFEMELVDKIEGEDAYARFDSIDGDQFLEAPSDFKDELYKHRFLSMLAMGGGIHAEQSARYGFLDMIREHFGDGLAEMYEVLIDLTIDILFKKDVKIDEKNPNLMGCSEVDLATEEEVVTIKAKGLVLPVLMIETVRGLIELFISHGLSKDMKTAQYILGKTEFLKTEPWDMRLGLILWNSLSLDVDGKYIPYLMKAYSKIPAEAFSRAIWAILTEDEDGEYIKKALIKIATHDYDEQGFEDRMGELNGKTMIADEYMRPDEF